MTDTYRVVITPTIARDRGIVFNTMDSMFSQWGMGSIWFYVQSQLKVPDNPVSEWLTQHNAKNGAYYDNIGTVLTQIESGILLFDVLLAFDPGDNEGVESAIKKANGKAEILRVPLQRNKIPSNEPVKTKSFTPPTIEGTMIIPPDGPSWDNESLMNQDSWRHILSANGGISQIYTGGAAGGVGIANTPSIPPSATVSPSSYVQLTDMAAAAAQEKAMAIMEYEKAMEEVKQDYDDKLSKLLMDSVNQAMAESEVPIAPAPGTNPKKPWWKF